MSENPPFDKPAIVPEDTYDRIIDSYLKTPDKKKKTWKYILTHPDGSKVKVQYENHLYYLYQNNIKYGIIGEESARRKGFQWVHPGHDAFIDMVETNATGNHTAK